MPKFPKGFGRRKLTAPTVETPDEPVPIAEHSFKVFDRAEGAGKSFEKGSKFSRASPISSERGNILPPEDDNLFENVGGNPGSSASNTLTSATDKSSRLSATSTVASSTIDNTQDWASPHDKPFTDIPPPPVSRLSTGFSLKNAGRAMSWVKQKPYPNKELPPSPPAVSEDEGLSMRSRAQTTSSYASTTVPTKYDEKDLDISLGGDFSDMFSAFAKKSIQEQKKECRGLRPESSPQAPSPRTYPAPLDLDKNKELSPSTNSCSGQRSSEGLIFGASPPPAHFRRSPDVPQITAQMAPRTSSPASSLSGNLKVSGSQDLGIKRGSMVRGRKLSSNDHMNPIDEDAQILHDSIRASRRMADQSPKPQENWTSPRVSQYKVDDDELAQWPTESIEAFSKSSMDERKASDDNLFDSTIIARANLALRFQERSPSPPRSRTPQTKVMTPAQFERYKQDQERIRNLRGDKVEDNEDEEEVYDDDDDAVEKARAVAKQRRKQEAHMAVYRQQMMKVIGETPEALAARPSMTISRSSPNLAILGQAEENEEEDEEVPLGILQAHGFPNKNKPPMRSIGSNPNLKAATSTPSGGLADPRLPVFARNLPHDPYYGSGIVQPMHRESMAFSGGLSANPVSANTNTSNNVRGLPPGGLVGVIATEERSRAMRRGSPIPQTDYPTQQLLNTAGPSPNIRGSTGSTFSNMGPVMPPQNPMGAMGLTPGDQAQIQMTQQMQQFMQMQMNFMQMMTHGGQQSAQPVQPVPTLPEIPRPASAQLHQRSLTLANHNPNNWLNRSSTYTPSTHGGNNYAPSIAPSERSNIGLPGRYRPVSQAPMGSNDKARASSLSGPIKGWDNRNATAPIRKAVKMRNSTNFENVSDEDEDEAWANMAREKKERKSGWKNKKSRDSSGLKEILGFSP
ncbi:BgTH12-05800 [Blumeria graminis f. sp. triticale]|uniref:Bgt-1424 n=3 Tax=Blumeria graminis TaxID=34373 RepID=A0A061HFH0_BLUGR|nr:hypothetical protein BGT96224_1424 [Blumeria graminis f. sp. tritici 96224]CAD6504063.1 BgTH12-05800 [Blumeria graminis f. sp. triticale]VDB90801.1 Bgt-1424 [Blumeria graminis f. sp. tritici]